MRVSCYKGKQIFTRRRLRDVQLSRPGAFYPCRANFPNDMQSGSINFPPPRRGNARQQIHSGKTVCISVYPWNLQRGLGPPGWKFKSLALWNASLLIFNGRGKGRGLQAASRHLPKGAGRGGEGGRRVRFEIRASAVSINRRGLY